jgi:hypothetical protein
MKTTAAVPGVSPSLSAVRKRWLSVDFATPPVFGRYEKFCLLFMAVGFLIPVLIPVMRCRLPEVGFLLFLFSSRRIIGVFRRTYLFLAFLLLPLLVEMLIPVAFFPFQRNLLLCFKLSVFAMFLFLFVNRCKNHRNAVWVCRVILLPLATVMSASFIIDRMTANDFFVEWHVRFTGADRFLYRFSDTLAMDSSFGNGFSWRPSDLPPWCFMGISSVIWLFGVRLLKRSNMLLLLMLFLFTLLFVPKRSSFLVLMATALVFIPFSGWRVRKWTSWSILLGILASFLLVEDLGLRLLHQGVLRQHKEIGGFNRLLDIRLGQSGQEYDDRIVMGKAQIAYLINHPRHLFFGAGWDFGSGVWNKPHSSIIAILAGGGLWGTLTVLVGIRLLFRLSRRSYSAVSGYRIYLISLAPLILYNIFDSAFFYAIEYPGSLFVLWLAWTVILYAVPRPAVFTRPRPRIPSPWRLGTRTPNETAAGRGLAMADLRGGVWPGPF